MALETWEFRKEKQSLTVMYVWFRGLNTFSDSVWIHIYIGVIVSCICFVNLFTAILIFRWYSKIYVYTYYISIALFKLNQTYSNKYPMIFCLIFLLVKLWNVPLALTVTTIQTTKNSISTMDPKCHWEVGLAHFVSLPAHKEVGFFTAWTQ